MNTIVNMILNRMKGYAPTIGFSIGYLIIILFNIQFFIQ